MEAVEFISNVALFKHLKEDAIKRLASQVRLVRFSEGHAIRDINRDTGPADGLYIIKSGVAKVSRAANAWQGSSPEFSNS